MPDDCEVSEFLLHACHDLRTPLRAIRTRAELILRAAGAGPEPASEHLGPILDGARKIELLTDAISRYAIALQTDTASFQITPMKVMLRTVLQKLDKDMRDSGATVEYGELPKVTGNPDRLMDVLESLLRNAILHRGPAAPAIHVSATQQDDGWVFAIQDNGTGIDKDDLETIFKPFNRVYGSSNRGAGLGLAACRRIIERHGGRMWAESQAGNGATIFFTLPSSENR
jgi:light-regulated signal transduction histidine kinase (bacteriophytochrome)